MVSDFPNHPQQVSTGELTSILSASKAHHFSSALISYLKDKEANVYWIITFTVRMKNLRFKRVWSPLSVTASAGGRHRHSSLLYVLNSLLRVLAPLALSPWVVTGVITDHSKLPPSVYVLFCLPVSQSFIPETPSVLMSLIAS